MTRPVPKEYVSLGAVVGEHWTALEVLDAGEPVVVGGRGVYRVRMRRADCALALGVHVHAAAFTRLAEAALRSRVHAVLARRVGVGIETRYEFRPATRRDVPLRRARRGR